MHTLDCLPKGQASSVQVVAVLVAMMPDSSFICVDDDRFSTFCEYFRHYKLGQISHGEEGKEFNAEVRKLRDYTINRTDVLLC